MTYPKLYNLLESAYGALRGYGRWDIRREVAANTRLSPEALREKAEALFEARVRDAVCRFPAYARKVQTHRGRLSLDGKRIEPQELPVWTKDDQRGLMARADENDFPPSFVHATGGSTGSPLRFRVTRESYEWRTAVSDRGYSWAGAEQGRNSVYVWGAPITLPSRSKRLASAGHHALQRRFYFDSFHFGDTEKAQCCRIINRRKPAVLVGYAGNLVELAVFVRDNPRALQWRPPRAVAAAEGLPPGRRQLIQEFLADELFLSYGSREFMLIGMECAQHAGYHVSTDNLLVEVVDDQGRRLPPGETGRMVVTDLHNRATPFIRYEIGDLGIASDPDVTCACGLPFPVLQNVVGRSREFIFTVDGKKMTALFIPHLMKEFEWIDGYQVIQKAHDHLRINLIACQELSEEMTQPIKDLLQEKVGHCNIQFQRVSKLVKTPSGKTPIVIMESGRQRTDGDATSGKP